MIEFWTTLKNYLTALGNFATHTLIPTVLLAVAGLAIIAMIMRIVNKTLEKTHLEKAAHSLIKSVARFVLYFLLGLIIASRLGIDVTGIIALASVLTLAISLAVQNALTNVIGGFTLLYTKPFSSGDFVEIAGQAGSVQEIGLTYTKLATADNKNVSIPNSSVTAAQIINYTVLGTRRVEIAVSASYDAPVEQVLEALRQAGSVETALAEPAPFAAVESYGDSAINYILRVWTKSDDYADTRFAINKNVKAVFDAKGIEMTYPHLHVHLNS